MVDCSLDRRSRLEVRSTDIRFSGHCTALACVVALATTLGCKPKPEDLTKELVSAAFAGDVEATTTALRRGADPNRMDAAERTPLALASCHGFVDVVEALLEAGADPTKKFVSNNSSFTKLWMEPWMCTIVGETQLHPEKAESYEQIRDLLKQYGAKDPSAD